MRRVLLWFNIRRLVVAILFVALFAMAVRVPVDTDTWWHLAAGRETLESGHILQTDLFSHTRYGLQWINHSWLSQVMLYWLFERFSYAGLGLWMAVVVTAAFVLVYLQMEGDPFTRAFILILAAATSAVVWIARPQLLSFLLTAAVAYILYLFKWRRVNRLWLLPLVFVLWVNLHAGYALGFMVLAAFVAGEVFDRVWGLICADRRGSGGAEEQGRNHTSTPLPPCPPAPLLTWRAIGLIIGVTILSVLLLVVNPNTIRMWTYYLDTVRIGVLQDFIQEWRSPDFHPLYTHPFIWLLLATLAVLGLSGRRVDGSDLALVGMFAYASLLAGRNFGPFALVAAPVLSRHVTPILRRLGVVLRERGVRLFSPAPPLPRSAARKGVINLLLLILVVALAVVKVRIPLTLAFNEREQRKGLPVGAVEWVRQHHPSAEMFNPYNWGGYLVWALWPDYRVFVDGRTDLYGDALLRQYLDVQLGRPGFQNVLAEYGVNLVLTYPDDSLSIQLACSGEWRQVYRDEVAVIWVREDVER